MPLEVTPPNGTELLESAGNLRLRGSAAHILEFASSLRTVSTLAVGDSASLGRWLLAVSDYVDHRERVVTMTQQAWLICACKFAEVANGYEESPFDFSMCGFLVHPPQPDIGVELVGPPKLD